MSWILLWGDLFLDFVCFILIVWLLSHFIFILWYFFFSIKKTFVKYSTPLFSLSHFMYIFLVSEVVKGLRYGANFGVVCFSNDLQVNDLSMTEHRTPCKHNHKAHPKLNRGLFSGLSEDKKKWGWRPEPRDHGSKYRPSWCDVAES